MSTSSSETILQGLKRYRINRKIGSGGMASVYLAHDALLKRDVAVKIMHEHLLSSPETIRRFTTEAHVVAMLNHDNVIAIFDCGEINSRPYLVMEYIDGIPLSTLIEQQGTIPNLVMIEICRQILSGLAFAYSNGIIHRDIKPDNIMIDRTGTVKIMDFGIAYFVNRESLTLTGSFIGSPRFISPEQAEGKTLTGSTDVFSLGVLLYTALAGKMPFNADFAAAVVHAIIHHTPPPLHEVNPRMLYWLSDFIDTCLIKDPGIRPEAAAALARLERECLLHEVTVTRELLKSFLDTPKQYAAFEEKKLFEHYRRRGRDAAKNRQFVAAVKFIEQAGAFGLLLLDDTRFIARCRFRRRVAGILKLSSISVAVAGVAVLAFFLTPRHDKKPVHTTVVVPASVSPAATPLTPVDSALWKEQPAAQSGISSPDAGRKTIAFKRKPSAARAARNDRAVKSGGTTVPLPAQEEIQTGRALIIIRTNPPWATVYIDDLERGSTPETSLFAVKGGTHEIKIIKQGFAEYRTSVTVPENDTLPLKFHLVPLKK